jgi:hypothetical protein
LAIVSGCCQLNRTVPNIFRELKSFATRELKINPQQIQIFTPLPSTYSDLMYFTGRKIFVEKNIAKKQRQKDIVVGKTIR